MFRKVVEKFFGSNNEEKQKLIKKTDVDNETIIAEATVAHNPANNTIILHGHQLVIEDNTVKSNKNSIEDQFIVVEVDNPCSFFPGDANLPRDSKTKFSEINMVTQPISPDVLPYKDESLLDPHKNVDLPEYGIDRDTNERMVLRADRRNIEEIDRVGGFHPQYTNPLSSDPMKLNPHHRPLNVVQHRRHSFGSGFVSTTSSQLIAHYFGSGLVKYNEKYQCFTNYAYTYLLYCLHLFGARFPDTECGTYTVYTLLVRGAMTPATSGQLYDWQKEYSVPGGIDKEDILAFRTCTNVEDSFHFKCSDIFVNKKVLNKNPKLLSEILKTQLIDNETTLQVRM
jgi:hypothetical protein